MKKLSLFLLCSLSIILGYSQNVIPLDSVSKKISFSNVVLSKGTKEVLFDKALEWFALNFKSSNDVIQIKDKEAGKILGSFTIYNSDAGPVSGNIIILLKDGKYKYTITDLMFNGSKNYKPWALEEDPNPWSVGLMKKGIKFIKENSYNRVRSLVESLISSMEKPTISDF